MQRTTQFGASPKPMTSLLEGDATNLQGVQFLGATLWSDYGLAGAIDATMLTGGNIRFRDGTE